MMLRSSQEALHKYPPPHFHEVFHNVYKFVCIIHPAHIKSAIFTQYYHYNGGFEEFTAHER